MSQVTTRTSAGAHYTGTCRVGTVVLAAGSGAAARATITDATAGSSTDYILYDIAAAAGETTAVVLHGVDANNGGYLEAISGSGARVMVEII